MVIDISLQEFTASIKKEYSPWMKDLISDILNADIQIEEDFSIKNRIENGSQKFMN
jgi:hypothetical protein